MDFPTVDCAASIIGPARPSTMTSEKLSPAYPPSSHSPLEFFSKDMKGISKPIVECMAFMPPSSLPAPVVKSARPRANAGMTTLSAPPLTNFAAKPPTKDVIISIVAIVFRRFRVALVT